MQYGASDLIWHKYRANSCCYDISLPKKQRARKSKTRNTRFLIVVLTNFLIYNYQIWTLIIMTTELEVITNNL